MAQAAKMDFDSGGRMAEEESEGGGGSKKLIIIIIVAILLIGGGAAAYFLMFASGEEESAQSMGMEEEDFSDEENVQISSALEKAETPGYFYFRDPKADGGGAYLVNLMDGRHFLTIKLVAEVEAEEMDVVNYLTSRRPLLDDMIITQLAMLDSEAAKDPRTHDRLKIDLKRKVNSIFSADFLENYGGKGNPVKRILITNILLN